jgi:hypothetical protein
LAADLIEDFDSGADPSDSFASFSAFNRRPAAVSNRLHVESPLREKHTMRTLI